MQTAAPFGGSPGAITVGYYSVQDDVVVMHDESRDTDREAPALEGRGGSPRRCVPADARILAGEDARFQSSAQLSKRWSRVVDRRPPVPKHNIENPAGRNAIDRTRSGRD